MMMNWMLRDESWARSTLIHGVLLLLLLLRLKALPTRMTRGRAPTIRDHACATNGRENA